MQYREFGKLGFNISTFGLGCMRLPLEKLPDGTQDYGKIDEKAAIEMIRYAIDHGVNYVDTAYPYHNGNSEALVGKALKDGYREKVKLATKNPVWLANTYEDFEKYLDEQLIRLDTDYIDFYLLHSLSKASWNKIKGLNVLKFLDEAKKKGKIRHAAFSFHDELPLFKEIVDAYDWEMCQIQLNFLDEHYQAGVEGMRYAAAKGIPVVVMEPLKGGSLAQRIPEDIRKTWDKAAIKRNPVDWAFRWIYNFPEVTVVLSGVSNMDQLQEDMEIVETALPGCLTQEEQSLVQEVQTLYRSKIKVGCTGCRYCVPCPSGVAIPEIFSTANNACMFDDLEGGSRAYQHFVKNKQDASVCIECGQCEGACPQNIPIIEKLKEMNQLLDKGV